MNDLRPSSPPPALGSGLRTLRRARRLSLSDVADATGISASFLSLVETGRSDITIGRLTRLVDFYGVTINDLLPAVGDDADVVRRADARQLHSPDEGIDVYLLTSGTDRTMMPMLLVFEPGAGLAELGRHRGEEFVHVLAGVLRLEVEGSDPRVLQSGDSAYYPGDRPHLFRNGSDEQRLRLICVDSPPPL
ncbi:XRE family transcriptional regulator [Candidatus Solirubrobacter pratensis]|uniref:XRE family transcriptional regulator n=1 Tax=Candidatus Solirubrobacter pratensis TaxID=1298857 RepID=UPI000400C385|nr:XRE family transcriptional regulator [Candidatus Solirubrobacter pratensis]